jgi:hypothetical protein
MKTIITSILLLICFNVSAQDTITKERIRLTAYSTMDPNADLDYRKKDSILNVLKKMEYEQFMSIPQSEINLGLHKFKKQHITGNHLVIAGIASSFIGSLLMIDSLYAGDTYPVGIAFTAIGGGLTTAGFIVNIDSFRHLK